MLFLHRLTFHIELMSQWIEGSWRQLGGGGHALLAFVNVCASVGCLNFDPAYD